MSKLVASGARRVASNKPPTARTFNMTVQDAMKDSDVIAWTALVSKAPYRLAPLEMKELATPLQELLEKGKANVVDEALSRKERLKMIMSSEELIRNFEKMKIAVKVPNVQELKDKILDESHSSSNHPSVAFRSNAPGRVAEISKLDDELITGVCRARKTTYDDQSQ
ncbi:hypothetical protein AgCh_021842 [Apium graveolens]